MGKKLKDRKGPYSSKTIPELLRPKQPTCKAPLGLKLGTAANPKIGTAVPILTIHNLSFSLSLSHTLALSRSCSFSFSFSFFLSLSLGDGVLGVRNLVAKRLDLNLREAVLSLKGLPEEIRNLCVTALFALPHTISLGMRTLRLVEALTVALSLASSLISPPVSLISRLSSTSPLLPPLASLISPRCSLQVLWWCYGALH